jgi:hypothetical protein
MYEMNAITIMLLDLDRFLRIECACYASLTIRLGSKPRVNAVLRLLQPL